MALPRIGIFEAILLLLAVLILAAAASDKLFLLVLIYLISGAFLALTVRESTHWFLKDVKPRRDLNNFFEALIVAPAGVFMAMVGGPTIISYALFTIALGLIIQACYDWKGDAYRAYVIAGGVVLIQYAFFAFLAIILALLGVTFSLLG